MKNFLLFFLLVGLLVSSCSQEKLTAPLDVDLRDALASVAPTKDYEYFILPESDELGKIPQPDYNPLTPEKVALGNLLFFETALAGDAMHETSKYTYSCASCHQADKGFMPGRAQGIADGAWGMGEHRDIIDNYTPEELDVQSARALSLINVAYVHNTTWTGKFGATHANEDTEGVWDLAGDTHVNYEGMEGLESQLIEGQELHRMRVDEYVLDELGYRAMYDAAFGDWSEEERYTPKATAFAIAAYLRTVLANKAPYQQWLKGDSEAMTDNQKKGALLFYGKAGCFRCHKGGAMNANEFHAVGVKDLWETQSYLTSPDDPRNRGRASFTHEDEDLYKFRVPPIYNMKDSPFYFHGSSKHSLWAVIEYFNDAVPENDNVTEEYLSPFFHPLNLTEVEKQQLLDFVANGLHDPELMRYQPESVLSGNCIPNNDPKSKDFMGCE